MGNNTKLIKNNSAKEILINNNIKPSLIRIKILEYLMNTKTHPNAEEIYNHLKSEIPTLSKTSVYLNLNLFTKLKIIESIKTKNEQRFDFMHTEHINFYCTKCKQIFDIPIKEIKLVFNSEKFIIHKINLYVEGICEACART